MDKHKQRRRVGAVPQASRLGKVTISAHIEPELKKSFKQRCVALDLKMNDGFVMAIKDFLDKVGKKL